jgi:hypothetical protein
LAGHGRPGARPRPTSELVAACERAGLPAEGVPGFEAALRRATALAAAPPEGVLVIAGSHYGIAPAKAALCDDP